MKSSNSGYTLRCITCSHVNDERKTSTYCTNCGSVLTVEYNEVRPEIQYPLKNIQPDPLKNHYTALKSLTRLSKIYGADIHAKLEFENPTGCFKDRGSYVEVLKAIELGADAICLASTGNMAASVAAYACYFKIPCFVFVPEKTPEVKLAQSTIYDATIIKIKGDFKQCELLCREFAKSGNYYLAGDYVFRMEGQKSFSYELYEQGPIDYDYIFVPVGAGTNFAAIFKGLKELKAAGLVDHIPSFVAVQPEQSSPVVEGIFKKEKVIAEQVHTMADAVAVGDPFDFYKVMEGIQETDGLAFTATENELLESMKEMTVEEGLFTEPACAIPLACFKNNLDKFKRKKCLFVLTGTGLKSSQIVSKYSLSSPVLSPKLERVQQYIESGFPDLQRKSWGQSREMMMGNVSMDEEHTRMYDEYVNSINKKGKTLKEEEIKALKSLVYNEDLDLKHPVEVLDYKLTMRMHGLVSAAVKLRLPNGEEIISLDQGVGPMDAVLTAIKAETDAFIPLDVKNHEVEILSPDTDSLVIVTLTLEKEGYPFTTKAASPDTIEALIQAFVKGLAVANKALV
ncbi:MAG: pyridoxal-phosphate dependent enzyme [Balneolaceae bacterium]|nr:pyridoxal-phosphate dependent enzyme [Balneolaceae bacterium]MBO6546654.1 pyridoxal-phosphate dependent enzyme [Balneolaceae bacterium]MBO6649012.1 pyridoxal-phosphate dependent enzyme [Balneolaceae bacterium]